MSKVYLLFRSLHNQTDFEGIVSNEKVAIKFAITNQYGFYQTFELDDPELLNRIAKSEVKVMSKIVTLNLTEMEARDLVNCFSYMNDEYVMGKESTKEFEIAMTFAAEIQKRIDKQLIEDYIEIENNYPIERKI